MSYSAHPDSQVEAAALAIAIEWEKQGGPGYIREDFHRFGFGVPFNDVKTRAKELYVELQRQKRGDSFSSTAKTLGRAAPGPDPWVEKQKERTRRERGR